MKPEMILQADVLDIIFDNRNKEYGAYELRSHYNRRLKKAMLIIFSSLSIFVFIFYWLNNISHGKIVRAISSLNDTVSLVQVDLVQPPIPQPQIQHHQVATFQNTRCLIVPDRAATNPPPTVDQLDVNKIGIETKPGDLSVDIVQPSSEGNGKTNVTEAPPAAEKDVVIEHPDFMPQFPGGQDALIRFLLKNLRMPASAEAGTKIATLVRFIVDKDGKVTGVEFEKSGGNDFDNEVMRVMKKMPLWKPGMQSGKNVAVYFKLPVIFQVPDEN
ncbi:MAG TPA: TonB family protein [Puia sp.]|nr:TonB family protein [Puia sp.]